MPNQGENFQGEDAANLLRVVQEVSLARDLASVTAIVKRAARHLSGAEGVTFVLKDNGQCYYVDEDAISPLWKGKRFPATSCISGWAMIHRQTVVIEDIYADTRIPHDAYRPTFVKSLMMVPVRSEDPIAAIGAYWATPHKATRREVERIQLLADIAAVAIDNVQMIEAMKLRTEESTRLLEEFQREVAQREKAEEQFRQAQKMEAIGRLAGGVAHDFNNLLLVISGYANLAADLVGEDLQVREYLEQIDAAAEQAARLTRQLLAFSRKQVLQPEVLNLNPIVHGIDKMLRRLIGEDIEVVTRLEPRLDPVLFDPGQIEQILMNLVVNARDAMPAGGKLTIQTANVDLDETYAATHPDAHAGPHVMLAVTDTGSGMDAAIRAKIFDPFFTTKEKGKGTGLGLATVYGIVKQSGGNILVYSEPGHGSTFKVYLPRAEESGAVPRAAEVRVALPRGGETILLVEDDDSVRGLLTTVLRSGGYQVLPTGDVEEAVRICTGKEPEIHMLLTDVVLPKWSGPELGERVKALRPGLRLVFMSGYTDDAMVHRGMIQEGSTFIEKPIAPKRLLEKIREYLTVAP